jgi:hypothetical protein
LWDSIDSLLAACTQAINNNKPLFQSTFTISAEWFLDSLPEILSCAPRNHQSNLLYGTLIGTLLNVIMNVPTYFLSYGPNTLSAVATATHVPPNTIVCGLTNGKWYTFVDTAFVCAPAIVDRLHSRTLLTVRHHQELPRSQYQQLIEDTSSENNAIACLAAARSNDIHNPEQWIILSANLNRRVWLITGTDSSSSIVGVYNGAITSSLSMVEWQRSYPSALTTHDIMFMAPQSKSNPSSIMISKSHVPVTEEKIGKETMDDTLNHHEKISKRIPQWRVRQRAAIEAVGRCGWLGIVKSDNRFSSLAELRSYIHSQLHHELSTITTTNNLEQQMMERWNLLAINDARDVYVNLLSCGLIHGKWFNSDVAAILAVLLDRTIWIVTDKESSSSAAEHKNIYCYLSPTKSGVKQSRIYPFAVASAATSTYHHETDYVFLNNNHHFEVLIQPAYRPRLQLTMKAKHDGTLTDDELAALMNSPKGSARASSPSSPSSSSISSRSSSRSPPRLRKRPAQLAANLTLSMSSSSNKRTRTRHAKVKTKPTIERAYRDDDGLPTHEQIEQLEILSKANPDNLTFLPSLEGEAASAYLRTLGPTPDARVLRGVAPSNGSAVKEISERLKKICRQRKASHKGAIIVDGHGSKYGSDHINPFGTSYAATHLHAYLNRGCVPADSGDTKALPTYIIVVHPDAKNVELVRKCHLKFTQREYHPSAKDDPSPQLGNLEVYIKEGCRFMWFKQCKLSVSISFYFVCIRH